MPRLGASIIHCDKVTDRRERFLNHKVFATSAAPVAEIVIEIALDATSSYSQ
jgi:hypothetical protein